MMPMALVSTDFMVHYIPRFQDPCHRVYSVAFVCPQLSALVSRRIWASGSCDGPGRGTCQVSGWDHVFLGLFWMFNTIAIAAYHFSLENAIGCVENHRSDGNIAHITGGNLLKVQNASTVGHSNGHKLSSDSVATSLSLWPPVLRRSLCLGL